MSARFSPQSFPGWALLLVVAGLLLVFTQSHVDDPMVADLEDVVIAELNPGPEAREWLADAEHFAPQRFPTPADAAAFVEELYQQGALGVYVPDNDTLVAELPADAPARAALFRIHHREAAEPIPDWGQERLVFHWDSLAN